MFDVINQCREALKHPKYTEESTKKRKEVDPVVRYKFWDKVPKKRDVTVRSWTQRKTTTEGGPTVRNTFIEKPIKNIRKTR